MTDNRTGDNSNVVPLRPARPGFAVAPRAPQPSAAANLDDFSAGDEPDDYRHRMLTNIAAVGVVAVLVVTGVWLANSIAQLRKNQDCVLQGRRACAPMPVIPGPRWDQTATTR